MNVFDSLIFLWLPYLAVIFGSCLLSFPTSGSLRDVLRPTTDEARTLQVALFEKMSRKALLRQVFDALTYIHSNTDDQRNKISHRDVKPENLLVVALERDGSFALKFTDFDSAKQLDFGVRVSITTGAFTVDTQNLVQ